MQLKLEINWLKYAIPELLFQSMQETHNSKFFKIYQ